MDEVVESLTFSSRDSKLVDSVSVLFKLLNVSSNVLTFPYPPYVRPPDLRFVANDLNPAIDLHGPKCESVPTNKC